MEPDFLDFGHGSKDDLVPSVDPADLRSVWNLSCDTRGRHPNQQFGIGVDLVREVCGPGANCSAVSYRCMMLGLLDPVCRIVPQRTPSTTAPIDPAGVFERAARKWVSSWQHDGELHEAVFKVDATFPMGKMQVGVIRHDFPFDLDGFLKQIEEAAK